MLLFQSEFKTPLGDIVAISSLNGLCLLTFQEEEAFIKPFMAKISQYYQNASLKKDPLQPILKQTSDWLQRYFEQEYYLRDSSSLPPLDLIGTPFMKQVWQALLKVSHKKLKTYGWLAEQIQNPKAVRAVGRAVGDNPIAFMVPCHRIIGANGKLTGYRSGLWRKEWLLKHEKLIS